MAQYEPWVTGAGGRLLLSVRLWMLEVSQSNRQTAPPLTIAATRSTVIEQTIVWGGPTTQCLSVPARVPKRLPCHLEKYRSR